MVGYIHIQPQAEYCSCSLPQTSLYLVSHFKYPETGRAAHSFISICSHGLKTKETRRQKFPHPWCCVLCQSLKRVLQPDIMTVKTDVERGGIYERHSDIPRCSANQHPPWRPTSAPAVETQQFLKKCLSILADCLCWCHYLEDSDHRDSGDGCWRWQSVAESRGRAPGLRGATRPRRRKRNLRKARPGDLLY